jgi:hypothetical protein
MNVEYDIQSADMTSDQGETSLFSRTVCNDDEVLTRELMFTYKQWSKSIDTVSLTKD